MLFRSGSAIAPPPTTHQPRPADAAGDLGRHPGMEEVSSGRSLAAAVHLHVCQSGGSGKCNFTHTVCVHYMYPAVH